MTERLDTLPYLEDETPNVLIESFAPFYVQWLCLFKNSQHVLDVEEVVKEYLDRTSFTDGDHERSTSASRFPTTKPAFKCPISSSHLNPRPCSAVRPSLCKQDVSTRHPKTVRS
ncbi:hypothetical protein [Mesorhizobium sp. M0118]|uniref:hypothetical protein n=1 Tax=Mesorhizobium sp. M0118 TaxID=2956884 RepID=UPI00333970D1